MFNLAGVFPRTEVRRDSIASLGHFHVVASGEPYCSRLAFQQVVRIDTLTSISGRVLLPCWSFSALSVISIGRERHWSFWVHSLVLASPRQDRHPVCNSYHEPIKGIVFVLFERLWWTVLVTDEGHTGTSLGQKMKGKPLI